MDSDSRAGRFHSRRTQKLAEVSALLFLIVPSMVLSFFVVNQGHVGFVLVAASIMLRDAALMALILYFVRRDGESYDLIGWRFDRVGRELALGVLLFVPLFFGTAFIDKILQSYGLSGASASGRAFLDANGTIQMVVALMMVIVVAVAEETIFRGYLMLRFIELGSSPIRAAVWSSAIFSLGHGYEGSSGVVTVGMMGFVFALVFLWRKSLVAPMVMHFLQDFLGIVVAPLLLSH